MTSFRRNPWFDDEDEDDDDVGVLGRLGSGPTNQERINSLEETVAGEQQSEQRVEAARGRGGTSPRVLELAEGGLRGSLSDAQKLYAKLGEELGKPTLNRQVRHDLRDARRVLEEAWGVNALRIELRPSTKQRFKTPEILAKTVKMPLDKLSGSAPDVTEPLDFREPMVTLQAVASFGRKYVPLGRGRMGQRPELKGVYYGLDAQDKADRDYAQMLIDEGLKIEARLADMTKRLVPRTDSRYERATGLLEENKRQKKALVTRRLQTVEELLQMKLLPDDEVEKLRQAQKPPPRVRPPR